MLAQPIMGPPLPWYLTLLEALYPLFGFLLIGEGVVRLALLLMSRRHGEKEWMQVMANNLPRSHRPSAGWDTWAIASSANSSPAAWTSSVVERDGDNRFVADARATGAPILIRDMKDDQALIDAGIERARVIVVATNDDMANLEVAMDAKRMNKNIRILLRLFDQRIAMKIAGAMAIDAAFSASALAAPIIAAMSLKAKVLTTTVIAGVPHVISALTVETSSSLAGKRIDQIELGYSARILARTPRDAGATQSPPTPGTIVEAGDVLIAHVSAAQLTTLSAAASGAGQTPLAPT